MLELFGEMELAGLGFAGLGITGGSGVTGRPTMSRVRASTLGDGVEAGVGVVLRGKQRTLLALSAVVMEGLMVFWRTAVVNGDPDKKTLLFSNYGMEIMSLFSQCLHICNHTYIAVVQIIKP